MSAKVGYRKPEAMDTISRSPVSGDEINSIVSRLYTTHTVSSKGGEGAKTPETRPPPGYGLKMYPIIDGIETRFRGDNGLGGDKAKDIASRLHTAMTKAASARVDYPRILLYPERTTLMNNTDRIVAYQQTGSVVKQKDLARRERWYN